MTKKSVPTPRLHALWQWLDDKKVLFALTAFLFAFIPLYPKLPLADLITGYIVRLRLEDLIIGIAGVVWFIQLIRKKISLKTPLTIIITLYLLVGLASSYSAVFVLYTVPVPINMKPSIIKMITTQTLPLELFHVAKLLLHYFRRVEYFALFFIAYAAIKEKQQVKKLIAIFSISALLVAVYGFGQKYLYWPVYSTMNREFSKGLRLYLTEHARVQSTFGGHYDFAAYLVMVLPLVLSLFFYFKNRNAKILLAVTYLLSLWGLMMTSSRSSFLAYVAAITIVLVLFAFRKGLIWFLTRAAVVYGCTAVFFYMFGDLSQRFSQIFNGSGALDTFQATVDDIKTKAQQPFIEPPKNGISIDDVTKAAAEAEKMAAKKPVIDQSDTQPTPVEPLPPDVFVDVPAEVITTTSPTGEEIKVEIPRVFSENAHRLGLSAAIRLDTLWPFAIRGFLRNPWLGSGYSTLTKYTNLEFTEAESTDNDFLRTLGETGALGFIMFYGVMVVALVSTWKAVRKTDDAYLSVLAIAFTAATVGLLINAVYIDVFISSKVIQVYWIFTALVLAYAKLSVRPEQKAVSKAKA